MGFTTPSDVGASTARKRDDRAHQAWTRRPRQADRVRADRHAVVVAARAPDAHRRSAQSELVGVDRSTRATSSPPTSTPRALRRPGSDRRSAARSSSASIVAVVAFPLGIACAVYLEEYARGSWFATHHPGQRSQPRRRAVDRVRPPRPRDLRQGAVGLERWAQRLRRRARDLGTRAPDRRDHHVRGAPSGAAEHPRGRVRRRRDRVGDRPQPRAALGRPGILTGTVLSPWPAPPARRHPSCWSGRRPACCGPATRASWQQLQGPFTALPVAIFSYARQPGDDFRSLTAAASLVLLVAVLLMNAVAIWLRNRYEKKW